MTDVGPETYEPVIKSEELFKAELASEILIHGEKCASVARIYNDWGEFCLNSGDLKGAKVQLEKSLKISTELAEGQPSESMVDTHYRLGQVIAAESRVTGSSEASKKHLLKTLGLREAFDNANTSKFKEGGAADGVGENGDLPTLSSTFDSTLIYSDQAEDARALGEYNEAGFLYLRSIKLRRKKFGISSPAVAQVLIRYGELLRMHLKYAEARTVVEEALAIYVQAYGPKHATVSEALNNLGQIQRLCGNLDEAEALLLEALRVRREMNGDYHLTTASTLNNLAETYRERGDFFQAINYHNATIESFEKAEGADHPGTINAKGNLGVTLRRQARNSMERGEELVREAVEYLHENQYDPSHPWVVKFGMENVLAQAQRLTEQGKHDESVQLYDSLINKKQVMAQLKAAFPSYGRTAPQDLLLLTEGRVEGLIGKAGKFYMKGKYVEADNVYNSCIEPSKKILGDQHVLIFRGTLAHSETKLALSQYDACKDLLVEAIQRRTDLLGPDHIEVAEATYGLAELYRAQAQYVEAEALYLQVSSFF